jgi:hypothetical protein
MGAAECDDQRLLVGRNDDGAHVIGDADRRATEVSVLSVPLGLLGLAGTMFDSRR